MIIDNYKNEQNKIWQLLGKDAYHLFKTYNVFIAGGAITSLFCNREVNDIDVYFRSKKDMILCMSEVFSGCSLMELDERVSDNDFNWDLLCTNVTTKSVSFTVKRTEAKVQFICFKFFENVQEIFDTFDFTVCMGAYSFEDEMFHLHKDFLKHNSQRYLKFNTGTAFPIMSALRVNKYIDKGYTISKTEYLRVVAQCMSLEMSSWADCKEHIGGMYGWDLETVFNEDKEFSLTEFINQLSELENKVIPKFSKQEHNDFEKIVLTLYPEINDVEPEKQEEPWKDGYYYKAVSSDWESLSFTPKIKYEVGATVEGREGFGIFVNKISADPYYTSSNYWVELEPTEGTTIQPAYGYGNQLQLLGPVRVNRQFFYTAETNEFEDKLKKYLNEE